MPKTRVPAVVGWFTTDEAEPELIGARGTETGSYFWPLALASSANPTAPNEPREEVHLSRRGTLWSWTTNEYKPPDPYVSADPFVPYTVCAVELAAEGMTVLGQLARGTDPESLRWGQEMELVVGVLYEDDEHEYTVWNWAPVSSAAPAAQGGGTDD
jgi:uncharacterized OB-fold protein